MAAVIPKVYFHHFHHLRSSPATAPRSCPTWDDQGRRKFAFHSAARMNASSWQVLKDTRLRFLISVSPSYSVKERQSPLFSRQTCARWICLPFAELVPVKSASRWPAEQTVLLIPHFLNGKNTLQIIIIILQSEGKKNNISRRSEDSESNSHSNRFPWN